MRLVPLRFQMECCSTQDEMHANVEQTFVRGFEPLDGYLNSRSGTISICGSAPSLENTWRELRGDVLAINGALEFLLNKRFVPRFVMLWDAAEIIERFAIPHRDITYFVAARCHPKVFRRLEGCRIVTWFAGGDHDIEAYLRAKSFRNPIPLVNGGSTGVTRALYLAYVMGYRDLHLFGADACYADDGRTHVNGSLVAEKDMTIFVGNSPGRAFRTTPEWGCQINEYKSIYPMLIHPDCGASVTVHGGGMMGYVHQLLEREYAGMTADEIVWRARWQIEDEATHTQPLEGHHGDTTACV